MKKRPAKSVGTWIKIGLITLALVPVTQDVPFGDFDRPRPAGPGESFHGEFQIRPKKTVSETLRSHGLSHLDIHEIVRAAKPYQDLSRTRAGAKYLISGVPGPVGRIDFVRFFISPAEHLDLKRVSAHPGWKAAHMKYEVETRLMNYSGRLTSSLWESATEAGMDPSLIAELTEIFAWQVDFAREVRVGDQWRLTVEDKFAGGNPIGWGRIIAAEYRNSQTLHSAVLFRKDGRELGYFAPDGSSLKRMFLKAPIKFGRISSRFNRRRFHPILHITRPHLGVDYAAAPGTPIRAVGDGSVIMAAYRGGGGNTIKIRHNSIYSTAYLHLKGFAPGVRNGARVRQGQVIGYVGSTGLSSGPHLHFEFYENGRFIDPLGKRFPSADPVPAAHLAEFQAWAAQALATLPQSVTLAAGESATGRSPAATEN